jgi:hypothetical protein
VRIILPTAHSGSPYGLDVKTFISGRRFDTFSLHYVLQGIKLASMPWLGPSPLPGGHTPVTDTNKRRSLFESFLFWYIDAFVLPIVKTTFYVTESSAFRNRILFFRQDDWAVLCAPLINRLTESTFRKLDAEEAEEMLRQRKLGFSFVRLLPKETGVRPIVNLRRRKALQKVSVLWGRSEVGVLKLRYRRRLAGQSSQSIRYCRLLSRFSRTRRYVRRADEAMSALMCRLYRQIRRQ